MSSKRYPGKMLVPFLGKPIFWHVVERIKQSKLNLKIILATSNHHTDDPLALYAKYLGIEVVRGQLQDVMSRFVLVHKKFKSDAFFRVCGDSPLLFPLIFKKAYSTFKKNNYDLVTNIFPRTFPPGMSVELINTKTFLKVEKKINNKDYREHISKYFYKKKGFKIYNIRCKKLLDKSLKLTIDKPEDLKKLEKWERFRKKKFENLFPFFSD